MNIYQEGFRQDISGTIFKLTGKTWLKIIGVNAVITIVMYLVFFLLFLAMFANTIDITKLFGAKDPSQAIVFYQSIFQNLSVQLVVGFIIVILLFTLSMVWFYNFAFIQSDVVVKQKNTDVFLILKESFGKTVIIQFVATILLYLGFVILISVSSLLFFMHPIIGILGILLAFILSFKLLLVIPAIALAQKSIKEAFEYSLKHITFLRALKLFGVAILVFLILFLVSLALSFVSMIFKDIPIASMIVSFLLNILLGGFFMVLFISSSVALYYRYDRDIESDDDLSLDELLIND